MATWANGMQDRIWPKETLTLVTYDDYGNPIYEYVFGGLTVLNRQLKFDYAISAESTHQIVLGFEKYSYKSFKMCQTDKVCRKLENNLEKQFAWTIL